MGRAAACLRRLAARDAFRPRGGRLARLSDGFGDCTTGSVRSRPLRRFRRRVRFHALRASLASRRARLASRLASFSRLRARRNSSLASRTRCAATSACRRARSTDSGDGSPLGSSSFSGAEGVSGPVFFMIAHAKQPSVSLTHRQMRCHRRRRGLLWAILRRMTHLSTFFVHNHVDSGSTCPQSRKRAKGLHWSA